MYYPTLSDMHDLKEQGNLCPIYREIMADLETPVSAYLKIARGSCNFLLESVEGGQHIARYSFLGSDPYLVLRMDQALPTLRTMATSRRYPIAIRWLCWAAILAITARCACLISRCLSVVQWAT